ncbi:DUF389 domain-containing protein [Psychrobacter sp. 16-MNA-CIBAN-0192]|uniref:DUF389 domain-containing protein n=1 Tax=Psychrobacter sp. 16-MNA-CIBAN-0192 TaxID=3140448 RepID=UPI00332F42B6
MPIPTDHADSNNQKSNQKNSHPASIDDNRDLDSAGYQDNENTINSESTNRDRGNNNIALTAGLDNVDIETEAAQPLEAKITLSSPSPDVAIATLETADSEVVATEIIDADSPNYTVAVIKSDKNIEQSKDTSSKASDETVSEKSADFGDTDTSSYVNDDISAKTSDAELLEENLEEARLIEESLRAEDLSDDEIIEKKQEVIEDKKESKLESYKQFVAEQFSHQKVDYPEVRVSIEANALPSKMYFMMNVLSAIIASYGLIANSAAVVIGAMLVAMMLGPITGVALAIIDYRMPLLRKSLFTVAAGALLVIMVGFIIGLLHQDQPLTAEVLSRTQPTSMDLMIALAGGTAGAYAMVSPHLSVAVVGVAVATALVPPLASSGILFAHGEITLGLGAALLALTNIIAIQFTNAMVLWFLGFRRLVDDDYQSNTYWTFLKRNAVPLLLLIGLGVYLTINLNNSAQQQAFENMVEATINRHFEDKGNVLTNTQFNEANGNQIIRAVIRGETTPTSYDVQQIEDTISQDLNKNDPNHLPIKLQLRYMPIQVIESDPLIQEKLNKKDMTMLTN